MFVQIPTVYQQIAAVALASLLAVNAGAKELVTEFSGRGQTSTTTADFQVEAPWIIDWRAYSEFQGSMALEISLIDASTNSHQGRIVRTEEPGDGVKLFHEGGLFRLRINASFARWLVKVEKLTEEEAAQYTPREPPPPGEAVPQMDMASP